MSPMDIITCFPFVFGLAASQITQKLVVTTKTSRTVIIDCEVDQSISLANTPLHWYRRNETGILARILHIPVGTVKVELDPDISNRFNAGKHGSKSSLTISGVTKSDAGVYYCAYWQTGSASGGYNYKVFGSGTKVVVSDSKPKSPTVTIYHSSKPSENAFLCVASDMFPEIARVTWEKKGSPGESVNIENQRTTTIQEETNTISSLIMMESKQNEEVSKYFCRVEHDTGTKEQSALTKVGNGKPAPVTGGPEKCVRRSVTHTNVTGTDHFKNQRELLTISMSYSVLILKSVAYFGIVSVLIYKKA